MNFDFLSRFRMGQKIALIACIAVLAIVGVTAMAWHAGQVQIDSIASLPHAATPAEQATHVALLGAAQQNQKISLAAGLCALLLVLVGCRMLWRSLSSSILELTHAVEKVHSGDEVDVPEVVGNDEVADLAQSVHLLLQDKLAAQHEVEATNQGLNESVIGLLQAVFQLGERDLTVRAHVTEDLIGTVAASINQFADETGNVLGDVHNFAQQVRGTAESVRSQTALVEQTVRNGRQSLGKITQSLTQAVEVLNRMSDLSNTSNEAATHVSVATEQALGAVDGTVKGMNELRESISELEKRFKRLGERSQEISTAIALINTISERTHVLALNASMQAATAGEAGRGFAVVAEEVQRLSDSSRQATAQIAQLVGNIQAETNETLFTVNRLISEVVKQSDLAQRAGLQMTQTQEITSRLVGLVGQIATFSQQQVQTSAELQENVRELHDGTEQTARAVTLQSRSTESLTEQSQRLTDAVGRFKLNNQAIQAKDPSQQVHISEPVFVAPDLHI